MQRYLNIKSNNDKIISKGRQNPSKNVYTEIERDYVYDTQFNRTQRSCKRKREGGRCKVFIFMIVIKCTSELSTQCQRLICFGSVQLFVSTSVKERARPQVRWLPFIALLNCTYTYLASNACNHVQMEQSDQMLYQKVAQIFPKVAQKVTTEV